MRGSMTVEASYVIPFCFFVIGIVCYLGVFTYNQTVLKMTGYECIFQAWNEGETADLEENLREIAKKTAQKRVLAVQELKVTVKNTSSKIAVSYQGTQTMLNIPLEVTVIYEKTFPERSLRMLRGI